MKRVHDRLLLHDNPDALLAVSVNGEILHWNDAAEVIFGYSRDEALGRLLSDLIVPPDRTDEAHRIREDAVRQGLAVYESVRRRKDGLLLHVSGSTKAIRDAGDHLEYFLSTKKDVTGLKVQRDAKWAESKFRDLLESTPDAIVMVNVTGRVVLINSRAEKVFGYQRAELIGQPVETLLPRRFHAAYHGHREQFFAQPRTMGACLELYGLRKNGEEFPVEISLGPLDAAEGLFVSSAIRDVTARKHFENALRQKNMELADANRTKDNFLANVSHELRTPLNAIIGSAGTLLARLPGPLTADQEKQLKTFQASARHLLALINDLHDVAKIEAGQIDLHFESVVCQSVIRDVVAALSPEAIRKELTLEAMLPADDLVVRSDRRALMQIVLNLANNALQFTERGSVCIEVTRGNVNRRKSVEISIKDTGKGIRPEDQPKLFEPFTRTDISKTKIRESTGLELHLSRKLAELLGNQITFQSEYGKGSTFTLALFAE